MTPRSSWKKGVKVYALELIAELSTAINYDHDVFTNRNLLNRAMLNGAYDWREYSYGGCALIMDADIALRLCTKTELKLTKQGSRRPNNHETWLECQGRALYQASQLIIKIYEELNK